MTLITEKYIKSVVLKKHNLYTGLQTHLING